MAKKKNDTTQNPDGSAAEGTESTPVIPLSQVPAGPSDFDDVFGGRVVGWWALQAGNVIQGILRDSFETKTQFRTPENKGKKRVYKVEITVAGCLINPSVSDDSDEEAGELVEAEIGDMVGVDEKGFLKALSQVIIGQEIWIFYRGKEPKSKEYPMGRHVFVGPKASKTYIDQVTGEVMNAKR